MRTLGPVTPSPEQLLILEIDTFRFTLIRGGAGSGKTTSACLRLRKVLAGVAAQRKLDGDDSEIKALVLTFNRTLRGYIKKLVTDETRGMPVDLIVDTFAGWAHSVIDQEFTVIENPDRAQFIERAWTPHATPADLLRM